MKKIQPLSGVLYLFFIFMLLASTCGKTNDYTPPPADCPNCQIKNASGENVGSQKFCSEDQKKAYLAEHAGYEILCN